MEVVRPLVLQSGYQAGQAWIEDRRDWDHHDWDRHVLRVLLRDRALLAQTGCQQHFELDSVARNSGLDAAVEA